MLDPVGQSPLFWYTTAADTGALAVPSALWYVIAPRQSPKVNPSWSFTMGQPDSMYLPTSRMWSGF